MDIFVQAINRLCRWRMVLAGWQLGTRPIGDAEADAVRDHREATLMLRAELSAVHALLISKRVVSAEEIVRATAEECEQFSAALERRFPGFRPSDEGMVMDERATETCKTWRK